MSMKGLQSSGSLEDVNMASAFSKCGTEYRKGKRKVVGMECIKVREAQLTTPPQQL